MADLEPKTPGQAAATADRLAELLLRNRQDRAREKFDELAQYFEGDDE